MQKIAPSLTQDNVAAFRASEEVVSGTAGETIIVLPPVQGRIVTGASIQAVTPQPADQDIRPAPPVKGIGSSIAIGSRVPSLRSGCRVRVRRSTACRN